MPLMRLAPGVLAALCLALAPAAIAQEPPPPPDPPGNDHYLQSFQVNEPGSKLPRRATTEFGTDTTSATLQANLFDPLSDGSPGPAGPAEPNLCGQSQYGNTIWYDIYPDRPVVAKVVVNTVNFNPVIGYVPFNARTAEPDIASGQCIDRLRFSNEEMLVLLRRGGAYSFQVGGVDQTGGPAQILFDFFRPARVSARVSFRARAARGGIRMTRFAVNAPRGSRVDVRCSRRQCRRQVRSAIRQAVNDQMNGLSTADEGPRASKSGQPPARIAGEPRAEASRTLSFRRVRRLLKRGTRIDVRITQAGRIGQFSRFTITRKGIKRSKDRCMDPGSTRPRRSCG